MALNGVMFMSGYHTKDAFVDCALSGEFGIVALLLNVFGTLLTMNYSVRLLMPCVRPNGMLSLLMMCSSGSSMACAPLALLAIVSGH